MTLRLGISLGHTEVFACEFDGPIVLGRQREGEPGPFHRQADRLVIAPIEEISISREHVSLEPLDGGRVAITNASGRVPFELDSRGSLDPSETTTAALPALVRLGSRTVRIESTAPMAVNTLSHRTLIPGRATQSPTTLHPSQMTQLVGNYSQWEPLVGVLHQIIDLLQHAASEQELFDHACTAAVKILGLKGSQVLMRRQEEWIVQAEAPVTLIGQADPLPLEGLLESTVNQKSASFKLHSQTHPRAFCVAAPLLNNIGNVVGVIGAMHEVGEDADLSQVAQLHANLLELIAGAVASALLRIEREQESLALRSKFEQFFTKKLSRQLELYPDLLDGRDAEVTILFCDIRGFTRHSGRLEAAQILEWINGVMEALSECVMMHDGVLVDFIGDELMAMWGAPEEQPEHARLACQAALQMIGQIPELNHRWQSLLAARFDVGIGINTGRVRVGNTGCAQKFKYGPLGSAVNIASRIQGATKYFERPILISESTRKALDDSLRTRRLCQVRMVNLEQPLPIYELFGDGELAEQLCHLYEQALEAFEAGRLESASQLLGSALREFPKDGPSRVLLKRTLDCLIDDSSPCQVAWELPGK